MSESSMLAGRSTAWKIIDKLGEGDAGEVYLVESLLEGRTAILKRPHRSAFPSEAIRQASQIDTEGKILRAVENLALDTSMGRVRTPALLDTSKSGTEFSDRYFIVIEKASGFDLNALARAVTMGGPENPLPPTTQSDPEQVLFDQLVSRELVPRLLLLRVYALVLRFIQQIHERMLNDEGMMHYGAIWNDIKPDHLFWNPLESTLTLIDWGNGKFLQQDGTTKDRQSSVGDDARQFVQEMGRYLQNYEPEMYQALEWPVDLPAVGASDEVLETLQQRIEQFCTQEQEKLAKLRQKEGELIENPAASEAAFSQLQELQAQILQHGELPNYRGAENLVLTMSTNLASQGRWDLLGQVCKIAAELPIASGEKWRLLDEISLIGQEAETAHAPGITQALVAGLVDDWPAAIWSLAESYRQEGQPEWWNDLSQRARQLHFQIDPELLPPYLALNRIQYVLQSNLGKLEADESEAGQKLTETRKLHRLLIDTLQMEILPKWRQLEPEPPGSDLSYQDIEFILEDLGALVPNARLAMIKTLDQPSAQVEIVLETWGRKEFETARRGLRRILLWDPQRWRVLSAAEAIRSAPGWLQAVHRGPVEGEALTDFMTRVELEGRELRSRTGSAHWLDVILTALQRLRKGERASDLIAGNPDLVSDIPWISRVGWVPTKTDPPQATIRLARLPMERSPNGTIHGLLESRIGQAHGFLLDEPLDTWAPEARGSSARVFKGYLRDANGNLKQSAVKIMRRERTEYALPLFLEEAAVLERIQDLPGVTRMLEVGYIKLDRGIELPPETAPVAGRDLHGEVQRLGLENLSEFTSSMSGRIAKGWLPYLALEKRDHNHNLMLLCDAGYTRGRFLSMAEALRISIQICDLLEQAHERMILYRDFKLLHFYWLEMLNGVFIIDWNVAKIHPDGISEEEKEFDIVQFGARALHHIFTGRPAPGALPMGPTRPEEIDAAAHTYTVQWTYDDQRLPFEMKELIEQVLGGTYKDFGELGRDLRHAFAQTTGQQLEEPPLEVSEDLQRNDE